MEPTFTGLFTADRRLRRDQATRTRQNSRGTRRGLEVPEERDYYPYWGPTPWNDIAIMVSNNKTLDLMKRYIESPEYWQKCEFKRNYIPLISVNYRRVEDSSFIVQNTVKFRKQALSCICPSRYKPPPPPSKLVTQKTLR